MSDSYTPFAPLKYDQAAVSRQGWGMAHSGPSEEQLMVGFYKRSVLNKARSQAEGKPIYEGRDFVKIQHPGESLNVVDREATENDKARFRNQWGQYQQNVSQVPNGIPISLLFPAKPEVETTLRGYNIHTVEQLANLSAHGISAVGMGAQDWVNAAKKYMTQAEKGVDHHQHQKDLKDRDIQIETLKRQVEELGRIVNSRVAQSVPPPENFDYQTAQINTSHQSADDTQAFLQPPAQFVQDLSNQVQPVKRRGRPPGAANKPKET